MGLTLAFQPINQQSIRTNGSLLHAENNGRFNPFKEISEMMSSLDDIVDDFMGKRMGNGEVFYGQRKYKPSGRENTEGSYNGMGMSDKFKIDRAREAKADYLAMKAAREQKLRQKD